MPRKSRNTQPATSATLQEWMQQTGTNATMLLEMMRAKGWSYSHGHMSSVLTRSYRCSAILAIRLNEITGVPIKNLMAWPPARNSRTSRPAA